jgi:hypothetical protein
MNILDLNVKTALDYGLILTAVRPQSKEWIDLDLIDTFGQWRAAQEKHGRRINAAVHLNPSDLCVLDLDTPDALTVLSEQMILPPTMAVRTARGLHLYFRRRTNHGEAGEVWVGEHHLGQYICGNLLSHYALLPGSLHPSGVRYAWLRPPCEGIADLPSRLHDWVQYDSQPYEDFEDGGWED